MEEPLNRSRRQVMHLVDARLRVSHSPNARGLLVGLASGGIVVSFDPRQTFGTLEGDGHHQMSEQERFRHRWPEVIWLFDADYIDQFGIVTEEGRALSEKIIKGEA